MSSLSDSRPPPEYEPFTGEHEHQPEPYTDDPTTPSQPRIQNNHRVTQFLPPPKYRDDLPASPPVPLQPYRDVPSPVYPIPQTASPDDAPPSYQASVGASYPDTLISRIPPAYYSTHQPDEETAVLYGEEIGSLSLTVEECVARVIVLGVVLCVGSVVAVVAWNGYLW